MVPPSRALRCGIALADSRLVPPLDRLMLADYDPSIRTAETAQVGEPLMPFYNNIAARLRFLGQTAGHARSRGHSADASPVPLACNRLGLTRSLNRNTM